MARMLILVAGAAFLPLMTSLQPVTVVCCAAVQEEQDFLISRSGCRGSNAHGGSWKYNKFGCGWWKCRRIADGASADEWCE